MKHYEKNYESCFLKMDILFNGINIFFKGTDNSVYIPFRSISYVDGVKVAYHGMLQNKKMAEFSIELNNNTSVKIFGRETQIKYSINVNRNKNNNGIIKSFFLRFMSNTKKIKNPRMNRFIEDKNYLLKDKESLQYMREMIVYYLDDKK